MSDNQTLKRISETEVLVDAGKVTLEGSLCLPDAATSIVLFVHGSGSSRHSPRNRLVAKTLQSAGIATLLFDLLTPEEGLFDEGTATLRFDIDLLAHRLLDATAWIKGNSATSALRVGYFGASTGAAAALVAAAAPGAAIGAIVSRGGRPDLAGNALEKVHAPTLLIVGGSDPQVLYLNRQALARIHHAQTDLVIVPRATHLFQEPGALEEVARIATSWFHRFLVRQDSRGTMRHNKVA